MRWLWLLLALPLSGQEIYDLLLKNGHVIDPANQIDASLDILLDHERISEIAPAGKLRDSKEGEIFEASGLIVAPGFIDVAPLGRGWL